jgi:hypothetical protein
MACRGGSVGCCWVSFCSSARWLVVRPCLLRAWLMLSGIGVVLWMTSRLER